MERQKLWLLMSMMVFISCSAQKTERRSVGEFSAIQVSGSVKVIYHQSDTALLTVQADSEEIDRVITEVNDGVLTITNKGNFTDNVTVRVNNSGIKKLFAEGATNFETEGKIKADQFQLRAQGATKVDLNVQTSNLEVKSDGASAVELGGSCDKLELSVSGASSVKAFDLLAREANAETSGAAHARLNVSERFIGNASGASSIRLKGKPKDVTAESTAAASITRIEEGNKSAGDTVTYHWRKKKVIIVDDEDEEQTGKDEKRNKEERSGKFKHWRGLALGVNGYMAGTEPKIKSPIDFMELDYSRSFNLQLNLIERHFNIIRNNMKIVTGIGLDWHRYEFLHGTTLNNDTSYTWGSTVRESAVDFRKNRLRTTYLQVPLLLEFNTSNNPRRTFHVAVGAVGQWLIGRSVKQVYNQGGVTSYRVDRSSYNMAPFAVKAHLNFGYRGWTIYAEYGLTTLFKEGMGPALNPFAVGLRVIPFS